jgi:glycosyltransferase involved in cell wall biosynthesis
MRVGIDLLWVRPGKNGGTESYIRNILDGIALYGDPSIEYYLYVAEDNQDSFAKYYKYPHMVKRVCHTICASQKKRVIWQNLHQDAAGVKDALDVWFCPVYSKPFLTTRRVPYVTVIHDIQGLHYPEYFSRGRSLYFRMAWRSDVRTSEKIVTISNFCRQDMIEKLHIPEQKIEVIYNPIITTEGSDCFTELAARLALEDHNYLYTVSSIAKHKNIMTLLRMMKLYKDEGSVEKLVITGVKVNAEDEVNRYIRENHLGDSVIFTGFISNEERDSLYDHCRLFLFPSIFEGFGMPPVEVMMRGVRVLTTKMTSLYEVTQGKAEYVEDPLDEKEWKHKVDTIEDTPVEPVHFPEYELPNVIRQYEKLFCETGKCRLSGRERKNRS